MRSTRVPAWNRGALLPPARRPLQHRGRLTQLRLTCSRCRSQRSRPTAWAPVRWGAAVLVRRPSSGSNASISALFDLQMPRPPPHNLYRRSALRSLRRLLSGRSPALRLCGRIGGDCARAPGGSLGGRLPPDTQGVEPAGSAAICAVSRPTEMPPKKNNFSSKSRGGRSKHAKRSSAAETEAALGQRQNLEREILRLQQRLAHAEQQLEENQQSVGAVLAGVTGTHRRRSGARCLL